MSRSKTVSSFLLPVWDLLLALIDMVPVAQSYRSVWYVPQAKVPSRGQDPYQLASQP
jgi:hypothetical protein